MNRHFPVIGVISLFCACPAGAETLRYREVKDISLKVVFHTKKDWHVSAWQPEGMEAPDVDAVMGNRAAKICFWTERSSAQKDCTLIRTMPPNGLLYPYQTAKSLTVLNPDQTYVPEPLIACQAEYSGGSGGVGEQVTFWAYDKASDSFANAGLITLTEESEYRFVSVKGGSWLMTADAEWGKGETHYSPHHFFINAYRYEPVTGFQRRLTYVTPSKYPSLDDVEKIDVVSHELARTKKLLADSESTNR